jgi:hypothetical protein
MFAKQKAVLEYLKRRYFTTNDRVLNTEICTQFGGYYYLKIRTVKKTNPKKFAQELSDLCEIYNLEYLRPYRGGNEKIGPQVGNWEWYLRVKSMEMPSPEALERMRVWLNATECLTDKYFCILYLHLLTPEEGMQLVKEHPECQECQEAYGSLKAFH